MFYHYFRSTKGKAVSNSALKSAISLYNKFSLPCTKKILMLLTNGLSDKLSLLRRPMQRLKFSKVKIFSIGIGHHLNKNILKYVASLPLKRHLSYLRRNSDMPTIIAHLSGRTGKCLLCTVLLNAAV